MESENLDYYMISIPKCVMIFLFFRPAFYSGASVHKAYAWESEKVLREGFSKAASEAAKGRPAIIFIDEIDTMCPPRDARYSNSRPCQ
jgi:SpoVK/Ycf46/Vps4 family AAA+-type ATPase